MVKEKKQKKFSLGWFKKIITIFFILSLLIFIYAYFYYIFYAQKFYPGTKIGAHSISGKNYLEVLNLVNDYTNKVREEGIKYQYEEEIVTVFPTISSTEGPDLVYEIIRFNEQLTMEKAYDYSRRGNWWQNFQTHIFTLISGFKITLAYDLNEEELEKILEGNFSQFENPAENAHLIIKEKGDYEIIPEKEGIVFDYESIIEKTNNQIKDLNHETINISLVKDYPEIKKDNVDKALALLDDILSLVPLNLVYGDKRWEVGNENLKNFLDFKYKNESVTLGFNHDFNNYVKENIASEIDREVKEGKFEMRSGKVVEFQASQNGLALNTEETINKLEEEVIAKRNTEIVVVVEEILPSITTESINELGIKEIVGRGESNFRGSPRNRIHNIKQGSSTLHGLLIKPGEEFSLVKAIGEVDASTGYLPELVIKGNKTIPEYGGGLCQIGTTAFRLAIHTGLPITERSPHSYRVSYYEPAGFDATIYDPKPDLKFINDTGNYLLWQTRIEGYNLIFEFYGTYDGRKIEVTKPKLSNYVSPPPTKIIETEDLAPGEKKCTERAHTGASAVFYRTITYVDEEQKKETWSSVYKPWQEVCLVGKQPE